MGLTLLIFLTVSLGITAGYHILSDVLFPEAARVRQRMSQEFGKDRSVLASSPLFKNLEQLGKAQKANEAAAQKQVSGLKRMLDQADLKLSVQQIVNMALCLGVVLGGVGWWFGGAIFAAVGAVCGTATPFVIVRWKHGARREQFLNQLPSAFELMSRIIRAGQSVYQALQAVGDAFDDPIASEFAKCEQQLNLGLAPEVVFREMAERSGVLEMRIFVMALLIQTQSGGSLAEVLERLGGLVRARLRLKKQVRTLTAEGRLQGWTLVVLPFVIFAAIMAINRSYAEILLDHPELLAAAGGAMLLGLLWIRKIVNFDF